MIFHAGGDLTILEDLLERCPAVWEAIECLPTQSVFALSGTNRSLRRFSRANLDILHIRPAHMVRHGAVQSTVLALVSDCSQFKSEPSLQAGCCLPDSMLQGWSALQDLVLSAVPLTSTAATCLAQCELPGLLRLVLGDMQICVSLAAGMANANLPKLQHLIVQDDTLSVPALQHLAAGKWPSLRLLSVDKDYNALSELEVQCQDVSIDLLEGSNWPLLETLHAVGWNIHLSTASEQYRWPKLESVSASYMYCQPDCLQAKLQSISLAQVTQPEFIACLLEIQLPALTDLQILIDGADSPHKLLEMVCRANWPKLADLRLPFHDFGSVAPLRQADWCLLSNLDLSSNCLGSKAVRHLAACAWPRLRRLVLARNSLGYKGIRHLVCGHWPELRILDLGDNNLGHTAMQQLIQG